MGLSRGRWSFVYGTAESRLRVWSSLRQSVLLLIQIPYFDSKKLAIRLGVESISSTTMLFTRRMESLSVCPILTINIPAK
jgi:hypothetical protein